MIDATATAALSNRIAALLGGGHPNPDHQHQPPPRLRPPTPSLDLTIDGQAVLLPIPINADDPHAGAIPQLMAPLCLWLRGLVAASPQGRRVLVGVVGAAGAGKSYLCALLAAVLCRLADCEEEAAVQEGGTADGWRAVTLSMDAYHLPNAELEARGIKHLKGGWALSSLVLDRAQPLSHFKSRAHHSTHTHTQATQIRWTRPRCCET